MTRPVDDRRHFPRQRKGCYYERVEDCCWVCFVRFAVASSRRSNREEASERDATRSDQSPVRDGGE